MDDERMLTVEEVATRLGISRHQVYRRITRRDIPTVQARNSRFHYLVPEKGLEAYIAAGGGTVLTPPGGDTRTLLRAPEVAAMTGFTVETIRRMCYSGVFPYVRGNGERGHLRIPRAAVEEYVAAIK